MGKLKVKVLKKKQIKNAYSRGSVLEENGLLSVLKGPLVLDVLDKLKIVDEKILKYKNELEISNKKLETSSGEKYKIDSLLSDVEEASSQMNETAIAYGIYLFENGSKWISKDTPDYELDMLSEMLHLQKDREDAQKQIEVLKKEISIDELSLMIEKDKKNIGLLNIEKEKIDEEINKLNLHIASVKDKIKALKQD